MVYFVKRNPIRFIITLLVLIFMPCYYCQGQVLQLSGSTTRLAVNYILIIGLILIAILAFYSRYRANQKLKLLAEQMTDQKKAVKLLLDRLYQDRINLAQDIHNQIGPVLAVAKMKLSNFDSEVQKGALLASSLNLLDEAVHKLRSVSQQLIPEGLNFGLPQAIEEHCYNINQDGRAHINVQLPNEGLKNTIQKSRALSIYAVVKDLLASRIKYAEANQIKLTLDQDETNLIFKMEDNGKTTTMLATNKKSWESIGMQVDLLGGRLAIQTKELMKNEIEISLPNHDKND